MGEYGQVNNVSKNTLTSLTYQLAVFSQPSLKFCDVNKWQVSQVVLFRGYYYRSADSYVTCSASTFPLSKICLTESN